MSEKDSCVKCGVKTPYHMDTDIEFRQFYIEGAGQLCRDCYFEFFPREVHDEEEE